MKEYEWRLTWSGTKDTPMLRAAFNHCKVFPLFRDSRAQLIDHGEYMTLVNNKEIDSPASYWQIEEGKIGLISLSYYRKYSDTWERISSCQGDFIDGWLKCKKCENE